MDDGRGRGLARSSASWSCAVLLSGSAPARSSTGLRAASGRRCWSPRSASAASRRVCSALALAASWRAAWAPACRCRAAVAAYYRSQFLNSDAARRGARRRRTGAYGTAATRATSAAGCAPSSGSGSPGQVVQVGLALVVLLASCPSPVRPAMPVASPLVARRGRGASWLLACRAGCGTVPGAWPAALHAAAGEASHARCCAARRGRPSLLASVARGRRARRRCSCVAARGRGRPMPLRTAAAAGPARAAGARRCR